MTYKGQQAFDMLRKAIKAATMRAMYRSTVEARRYAEGISRGPWSLKDLADLDHPYAARHGRILGSVHPFWINIQSGTLASSWKVVHVNRIVNTAPYASYLAEGTVFMLGRPFVREIKREWVRLRENETQRQLALIGLPCKRS